jgi:hypothetical protein
MIHKNILCRLAEKSSSLHCNYNNNMILLFFQDLTKLAIFPKSPDTLNNGGSPVELIGIKCFFP